MCDLSRTLIEKGGRKLISIAFFDIVLDVKHWALPVKFILKQPYTIFGTYNPYKLAVVSCPEMVTEPLEIPPLKVPPL